MDAEALEACQLHHSACLRRTMSAKKMQERRQRVVRVPCWWQLNICGLEPHMVTLLTIGRQEEARVGLAKTQAQAHFVGSAYSYGFVADIDEVAVWYQVRVGVGRNDGTEEGKVRKGRDPDNDQNEQVDHHAHHDTLARAGQHCTLHARSPLLQLHVPFFEGMLCSAWQSSQP